MECYKCGGPVTEDGICGDCGRECQFSKDDLLKLLRSLKNSGDEEFLQRAKTILGVAKKEEKRDELQKDKPKKKTVEPVKKEDFHPCRPVRPKYYSQKIFTSNLVRAAQLMMSEQKMPASAVALELGVRMLTLLRFVTASGALTERGCYVVGETYQRPYKAFDADFRMRCVAIVTDMVGMEWKEIMSIIYSIARKEGYQEPSMSSIKHWVAQYKSGSTLAFEDARLKRSQVPKENSDKEDKEVSDGEEKD